MSCPLCEREQLLRQGAYPYLIHEFEHSWWLLGEHQYYDGYSVLLLKGHAREMTELPAQRSQAVFGELLRAQACVERALAPFKMNLCSLGNVVDHVHWHLFPRYQNDPKRENPPWLQMGEFSSKNISPEQAQVTIEKFRSSLR